MSTRRTILLVAEDEAVRHNIASCLSKGGFDVLHADQESVQQWREIGLIILRARDAQEAVDFRRRVGARLAGVPLLLILPDGQPADSEYADVSLTEPIESRVLLPVVTALLRPQALPERLGFHRLFDSNVVAIARGVGDICTEANQAYLDLIGATRDEMNAGKINWRELTAPEYRGLTDRMERQFLSDGLCQPYEKELVRRDGTRVPVLIGGVALDAPDRWMCLIIDRTQQKRAQEALRMNEKLAATGRIAASIAHEINNPMASVTNLLYLLGANHSLDEAGREYLEMAKQEVSRMTHIIKQMLGFYRESPQPVDVSLREIVESVVALYSHKMQLAHVTLTADFDFDGEVRAYPGEMRQVFANLIGNALEAVGPGGSIRLRVFPSKNWRTRRAGVRVQIADSGAGIRPIHLARLFEPFFTTKGEKGTGLGLWVTHGILGKHGGSIRVRSSVQGPRRGTTFSIFLPVGPVAAKKSLRRDSASISA